MANTNLAAVEAALRARSLDRTLTSAVRAHHAGAASTGIAELDARLAGGLPRGELSEIVGPRSSGRTTLLLRLLAVATGRGEIAALVDPFDCLDVCSAAAAGAALERLLWIRGQRASPGCRAPFRLPASDALRDRIVERALKAFNLVLQAGGFGVVAIDLADAPPSALRRIPFTTWLRVQRAIEGSETVGVAVAPQQLARSAWGVTLVTAARPQWAAAAMPAAVGGGSGGPRSAGGAPRDRRRRLAGSDVTVRIVSPRRRADGEMAIAARMDEGPAA